MKPTMTDNWNAYCSFRLNFAATANGEKMEKECVERRAFIQQCKNFGAACVYITHARSHLILCVKWPLVWHQQRRQLLLTVGSRPYNQTRAAE